MADFSICLTKRLVFHPPPVLQPSHFSSLISALLLICSALVVQSAEIVILAWDRNPEPDVIGYRVYFGTTTGVYPGLLDVGNATEAVLDSLAGETTYYVVVTAYNTAGLESEFSEEITFATDPDPPGIPAATLVFLEAESGTATLPLSREDDPAASGGVLINSGANSGAGEIFLSFAAPAGPEWEIWARVRVPEGGEASLSVSLDGQPPIVSGLDPGDEPWTGDWMWTRLRSADGDPEVFAFTGQSQTLVLQPQQSLAGLDRFILSADPLFVPAGGIPSSGDYVTVTRQPEALVVFAGAPAKLEVTAAATGAVTYQWLRDGVPLPEGQESHFALEDLNPNETGSYEVLVTSGTETATSGSATVAALVPPVMEMIQVERRETGTGTDNVQLRVHGRGTLALIVEYSTDLTLWHPLESFPAGVSGVDIVTDPGVIKSASRRFYRLSVPDGE